MKELAQWRNPELGAAHSSGWVAEECYRVLGQELSEEAGKVHVKLARDAKTKELDAGKQFKVPNSLQAGSISDSVVSTRWALTWRMADGKNSVKARVVAKGRLGVR